MSKQPKMSVCRNCNAPIGKNARICPSCGAKNTKPFYQKWWFVLLIIIIINYICLFNYLFISSQMSAKPYFIGSTGILLLW